MVFLRRWLRLPSPVDLGWSKTDALGMRRFTPYQEGKTWEDWHEYVQIRYPIRYFLAEAVPEWGKHWLIWPIRRFWAWLLDYLLPSRRYHLLDLRGVDPLSSYRHGYLDPCEMFRLAGWAALMRWHRESGSRQWVDQRERYREAAELILYWTVTRIQRQARSDQLRADVDAIQTTPENRACYDAASEAWLNHFRKSDELEEAMWLRLAALRPFLWD